MGVDLIYGWKFEIPVERNQLFKLFMPLSVNKVCQFL